MITWLAFCSSKYKSLSITLIAAFLAACSNPAALLPTPTVISVNTEFPSTATVELVEPSPEPTAAAPTPESTSVTTVDLGAGFTFGPAEQTLRNPDGSVAVEGVAQIKETHLGLMAVDTAGNALVLVSPGEAIEFGLNVAVNEGALWRWDAVAQVLAPVLGKEGQALQASRIMFTNGGRAVVLEEAGKPDQLVGLMSREGIFYEAFKNAVDMGSVMRVWSENNSWQEFKIYTLEELQAEAPSKQEMIDFLQSCERAPAKPWSKPPTQWRIYSKHFRRFT